MQRIQSSGYGPAPLRRGVGLLEVFDPLDAQADRGLRVMFEIIPQRRANGLEPVVLDGEIQDDEDAEDVVRPEETTGYQAFVTTSRMGNDGPHEAGPQTFRSRCLVLFRYPLVMEDSVDERAVYQKPQVAVASTQQGVEHASGPIDQRRPLEHDPSHVLRHDARGAGVEHRRRRLLDAFHHHLSGSRVRCVGKGMLLRRRVAGDIDTIGPAYRYRQRLAPPEEFRVHGMHLV